MNFVTYKNKKIVILDTEGLMSVESGNTLFDNQLATMAVLSSHLIIVNHKGEISSNLERLLGITFYAKLQTSNSKFQPTILFVLRDQIDRNKSSVATQASKLKAKLTDQTSTIVESIDDMMNIEVENVTLLSNPFAEERCPVSDRDKKWRNNIFPVQITELRALILQRLEGMDKTGHLFNNLSSLYYSMVSYWKTLEDLGSGILNCKDLEEIKMRNEISTKCTLLVAQFGDKFCSHCQKIIQIAQKEIEKNYSEEFCQETNFKINNAFEKYLREAFDQFEKKSDFSYFPDELKREYKTRIEQSLESVKYVCVVSFKSVSSHIKELSQLENIGNEMTQIASNMAKLGISGERFEKIVEKLNSFDMKYERVLKKSHEDNFAKRIQNCFNQNHGQLIYVDKYKYFKTMPKMDDLEEYINCSQEVNTESWFEDNPCLKKKIQSTLDFYKRRLTDSIKSLVKRNIIPRVLEQIEKPFVEDSHIRSVFEIINDQLFHLNSPAIEFNEYLRMTKLSFDIFKDVFKQMYLKYQHLQSLELEKNKSKYKKMKETIISNIKNSIDSMKDSKCLGKSSAENLIRSIEEVLFQDTISRTYKVTNDLMVETLKNPEKLVEHAFKTSFLDLNYENVFHYVRNTPQYFNNVCSKMTQSKLSLIIKDEINHFKKDLAEIFGIFGNFDTKRNSKTVHGFIDSIIDFHCQSELQKTVLIRIKPKIVDLEIVNFDYFKTSFKEASCRKIIEFQKKLIIRSDNIHKAATLIQFNSKKLIGCVSTCPGCGSKCNLQANHTGSHKSFKHILNGFKGWNLVKSKIVCTEYCWETNFFLNPVNMHDKVYDTFQDYLKEMYPDWLDDIKENYIKYYGGSIDAKNFTDFNYFMKKSWMNARLPIIKRNKIVDKEYASDWLSLVDEKRNLKKTFKLKKHYPKLSKSKK